MTQPFLLALRPTPIAQVYVRAPHATAGTPTPACGRQVDFQDTSTGTYAPVGEIVCKPGAQSQDHLQNIPEAVFAGFSGLFTP